MHMPSDRILIVDDDEVLCRAWRRTLCSHAFDVVAVHDLADARAEVGMQCIGRCVAAIPKPIDVDTLLTCLDKPRKPSARSTSLPPSTTRCDFSDRQIEVIRAAAEGLKDKEIALRLECKLNTIKTYWRRIFKKTGCHSRAAVIAIAAPTDSQISGA